MLKLEVGKTYKAHRVRNGESETGPWEVVVVKEEGGAHRELTMFAVNAPSGVKEGGMFKLESITSIRMKRAKDNSGKWTLNDRPVIDVLITPEEELPTADDLGVDDFYGGLL